MRASLNWRQAPIPLLAEPTAAWGGMRARRDRLGLVDVGQDAAAVIGEPGGGDRLSLRAALAQPTLSTTATKALMACRRSMLFPIQKCCLGRQAVSLRGRHRATFVCLLDQSGEPRSWCQHPGWVNFPTTWAATRRDWVAT
jgi:hypothetical protein